MSDNRTNVQIVADALRSMPEAERDDDRDPAVVVAEYAVAALVAAQGAAPQEPSRLPDFFAPKPMPNSYVPAPVPTSGVDEDALAEVIRQQFEVGNIYLDSFECKIAARAAAEWLEEQGVGKD